MVAMMVVVWGSGGYSSGFGCGCYGSRFGGGRSGGGGQWGLCRGRGYTCVVEETMEADKVIEDDGVVVVQVLVVQVGGGGFFTHIQGQEGLSHM